MTQTKSDGTHFLTVPLLALAAGLASLGTSIANIALPALAEAFAAPFAEVQSVVVAYLGAMTVSVFFAGRLGDRIGLKRTLVIGLALFVAASSACSLAPNLLVLIAARAIQGVGAAVMLTLSMALVRQMAGSENLGRAMGLLGTVSAIGTALGPSLGGLLIPPFGWRATFAAQVPLAILAFALALLLLPADQTEKGPPQVGSGPLLDRRFGSILIANLLVAAVMMATLVVGPFYLGWGLGLDATTVGLVMTIGPAISILSGVPSGRLVDTLGSTRVLLIGTAMLSAGAFMLAFLPHAIGIAGYVASIVVLTPGYQLFQAANNTTAMADVAREQRGTVSGLLNLSRNIGLIAGTLVMGTIFAYGAGTQDLSAAAPEALAQGMNLTFSIAGVLMLLLCIGTCLSSTNGKSRL